MAGNFLEQIKRAREAADSSRVRPEEKTSKPTEQMTGEELEEAITTARRKLLDAQHAELRERELSRVAGALAEQPQAELSGAKLTLAGILREKQAGKRRTWR